MAGAAEESNEIEDLHRLFSKSSGQRRGRAQLSAGSFARYSCQLANQKKAGHVRREQQARARAQNDFEEERQRRSMVLDASLYDGTDSSLGSANLRIEPTALPAPKLTGQATHASLQKVGQSSEELEENGAIRDIEESNAAGGTDQARLPTTSHGWDVCCTPLDLLAAYLCTFYTSAPPKRSGMSHLWCLSLCSLPDEDKEAHQRSLC